MPAQVKYHISKATGRPNLCRASKKDCPLGAGTPHFPDKESAREFFEKSMKKAELKTVSKTRKPRKAKDEPVVETPAVETPTVSEEPEALEETPEVEPEVYEDPSEEELEDLEAEFGLYDDDAPLLSSDACENCDEENSTVRYREDPYDKAVHGESNYRNLCSDCYEELKSEI